MKDATPQKEIRFYFHAYPGRTNICLLKPKQ